MSVSFGDSEEGEPRKGSISSPSPFLTLSSPLLSPTAHFGAKEAGDLSTLFDVGGILGWSAQRGHGGGSGMI